MDILWLLIGLTLYTVLVPVLCYWKTTTGTLRIDHSNPEKDIYRFEIDDIDKLGKKNRIMLKIDHHADLSQK